MRKLLPVVVVVLTALSGAQLALAAAPVSTRTAAPAVPTAAASPLTSAADGPVGIGDPAPDFTLTDTDGQAHHLADYLKQGKIVVLEWFCPACSMCEEYYKPGPQGEASRMEGIIASIAGPDTVWLSINSTGLHESGGTPGENAQAHAQWKMSAPLLLDPTGAVGQAYDAEYTPTVYVISSAGTLVYEGAPDDNAAGPGYPGINFVGRAVAQLRSKQDVSIFMTAPFGCPVDYDTAPAQTTQAPSTQ